MTLVDDSDDCTRCIAHTVLLQRNPLEAPHVRLKPVPYEASVYRGSLEAQARSNLFALLLLAQIILGTQSASVILCRLELSSRSFLHATADRCSLLALPFNKPKPTSVIL